MLTQVGYDTGKHFFVLMSRTTLPEREDRGGPGSVSSREGGAAGATDGAGGDICISCSSVAPR